MLQKDKVLLLHILWWRQEILLFSWDLQGKFRAKDLLLDTSMLHVTMFQLIFFVYLPSFNLPVKLFLCLFYSCSIDHSLYCYCLNVYYDSLIRHISCTGHIHSHESELKKGMIRCKENPHCSLNPSTPITHKNLLLKEKLMLFP